MKEGKALKFDGACPFGNVDKIKKWTFVHKNDSFLKQKKAFP